MTKYPDINNSGTVTVTTTGKDKKSKKKRGLLDWLVKTFRPRHTIHKNPPRGIKKVKKYKEAGE